MYQCITYLLNILIMDNSYMNLVSIDTNNLHLS